MRKKIYGVWLHIFIYFIYPGYGVFVCDNVVFSPGALVAHKVDP